MSTEPELYEYNDLYEVDDAPFTHTVPGLKDVLKVNRDSLGTASPCILMLPFRYRR